MTTRDAKEYFKNIQAQFRKWGSMDENEYGFMPRGDMYAKISEYAKKGADAKPGSLAERAFHHISEYYNILYKGYPGLTPGFFEMELKRLSNTLATRNPTRTTDYVLNIASYRFTLRQILELSKGKEFEKITRSDKARRIPLVFWNDTDEYMNVF